MARYNIPGWDKAEIFNTWDMFMRCWKSPGKFIDNGDGSITRIYFLNEEEGRGVTVARVPKQLNYNQESYLVEKASGGRDHHMPVIGEFFTPTRLKAVEQWYQHMEPGATITWAINQKDPWNVQPGK